MTKQLCILVVLAFHVCARESFYPIHTDCVNRSFLVQKRYVIPSTCDTCKKKIFNVGIVNCTCVNDVCDVNGAVSTCKRSNCSVPAGLQEYSKHTVHCVPSHHTDHHYERDLDCRFILELNPELEAYRIDDLDVLIGLGIVGAILGILCMMGLLYTWCYTCWTRLD